MVEKIMITNSGLLSKFKGHRKTVPFNFGLIGAATSSMIDDIPDRERIKCEVNNIRIVDEQMNKSLKIPDYCIFWILKNNYEDWQELLKRANFETGRFIISTMNFNVVSISKSGALLRDGALACTRLMALNDSHFREFDRDFLSYFMYLNFNGKLVFQDRYIKFMFNRIPLLCFKSENAYSNEKSRQISIEMMFNLSGRNGINCIFI